jgi:hypothetical protein
MIKFPIFSTPLHVSFYNFFKEFNEVLHFALLGITKKWYNIATIEKHIPSLIKIWEFKASYCNYYPDEQGDTDVEFNAEMTVFGLILWIISCYLLVGLVYLPFYVLWNRLGCSLSLKAGK